MERLRVPGRTQDWFWIFSLNIHSGRLAYLPLSLTGLEKSELERHHRKWSS